MDGVAGTDPNLALAQEQIINVTVFSNVRLIITQRTLTQSVTLPLPLQPSSR